MKQHLQQRLKQGWHFLRNNRLFNLLEILQGQLWFQPGLICLLFGGCTLGLYHFEAAFIQDTALPRVFFNASATEVRSVSIALLSAMLTMATLVVSITMVVLSLAAGQQGPRLIRSFMGNPTTQRFIGAFFGIVVSIFTLVIILHDVSLKDYSPDVTVTTVFGLCFLSLFVLLAYVHYLAKSSISDNVVKRTATELVHSIERLIEAQRDEPVSERVRLSWPDDFVHYHHCIHAEKSAYIQYVDYARLCELARSRGTRLHLPVRAGHFVLVGQTLLEVYRFSPGDAAFEQALLGCIALGDARTSTQDVTYSIRHLVEIGLRALSPGMNDCFTAITVLNYLSASLARLFQSGCMDGLFLDAEGELRLKAAHLSDDGIIHESFAHIRHSGAGIPLVLTHMLNCLETLANLAHTPSQRSGLLEEVLGLEAAIHTYTPRLQQHKALLLQCQNIAYRLKV